MSEEDYKKAKENISKAIKNAKPVDFTNFYERQRQEEKLEQERLKLEREKEVKRIDKLSCPVCKSKDKSHIIKSKNNGVMGPGYHSYVTDNYFVCNACGVHFSDIKKQKNENKNI